jgi:WLAB PROTEIN
MIKKLNSIMSRRDKIFLSFLVILSVILSIIETIGISVIMPFITIVTTPEIVHTNGFLRFIYNFFSFSNLNKFIVFFGVIIICFYFFRAIFSICYLYLLNKFSMETFHTFAFSLFKNYTKLPYDKFVKQNSAEMTKNISSEAFNFSSFIQALLNMLSEFFTVALLYVLLLFVNWKMTLVLTLLLGVKVLFLVLGLKKIIKKQGEIRAVFQAKFYRTLSETFGNFKMIKLIQNENELFERFKEISSGFARANIVNSTINHLPRLSLETIGFSILVGIIVYSLLLYGDASFILPVISVYALSLYRMLPAINRILVSYNQMLFLNESLDIIHRELAFSSPAEGCNSIEFKDRIELKNISFEYTKDKKALEDISITINKGEKIAFIGESGGGKSTLIDLIIGLYKPLNGVVLVDGVELDSNNIRAYRAKIGYIPQFIYLFDGTVGENVAFGHEYDRDKIIKCLKRADIYEFLSKKEGVDTLVGDGGIRLSGGQRQRIGIARALYNDPEILVLDEATSALDNDTEAKIMDEIYKISADKTLLIVAHRLSTIKKCNRKLRLDNGKLV